MNERSNPIGMLVTKLGKSPYLRESSRHTDLGFEQLSDYGLMVGGMLVRTVVELNRTAGRTIDVATITGDEVITASILQLAHYIGEQKDSASNQILADIFGSEFTACAGVSKKVINISRSSYNDGYLPREITPEDRGHALAIESALVKRGVAYLLSPEGNAKIWNRQSTKDNANSQGCPLLSHYQNEDSKSTFDDVMMLLLAEYANPNSPFYQKGYYGPAKLALKTVEQAQQNGELPILERYDWKFPQLTTDSGPVDGERH